MLKASYATIHQGESSSILNAMNLSSAIVSTDSAAGTDDKDEDEDVLNLGENAPMSSLVQGESYPIAWL